MRVGAGHGKFHGEGNVHAERWAAQAAKMTTNEIVALYERLPSVSGRFTARQKVLRRELERRNFSLRDLGIESA